MNKITTKLLAAAVCAAACASASAQTTYNQTIPNFIDGGGSTLNGFTQTTGSGLTIDLRANNRTDGSVNLVGNNVYQVYNDTVTKGALTLDNWSYSFQITADSAATLGNFSYFIVANGQKVNIGTFYSDNTYGHLDSLGNVVKDGSTPGLLSTILAQQENITFPPLNAAAGVDGTYTFEVYAEDSKGTIVDDTTIIVNVVPEVSSSMALFGVALLGLGAFGVSNRRQLAN